MRFDGRPAARRARRSLGWGALWVLLVCGLGVASAGAQTIDANICIENDVRGNDCQRSISGPAPLMVWFNAARTTTHSDPTINAGRYNRLSYLWNFDDPDSGSWSYGERSSRNLMNGPIMGHVFNDPGSYTVTLRVCDGDVCDDATTQVTVGDPDAQWAGSQTLCVGASQPTAGSGGCPSGADTQATGGQAFQQIIAAAMPQHHRVLFKGGDTFSCTGAIDLDRGDANPKLIGSFGTGPALVSGGGSCWISARESSASDWVIQDLHFTGTMARFLDTSGSNLGPIRVLLQRITVANAGGAWWLTSSPQASRIGPETAFDHMASMFALVDVDVQAVTTGCSIFSMNRLFFAGSHLPNGVNACHMIRMVGRNVIYTNSEIGSQGAGGKVQMRIGIANGGVGAAGAPGMAHYNQPVMNVLIQGNDFKNGREGAVISMAGGNSSADGNQALINAIIERNLMTTGEAGGTREHVNIIGTDDNANITVRGNLIHMTENGAGYMDGFTTRGPGRNVRAYDNLCYDAGSANYFGFFSCVGGAGVTEAHGNVLYAPNWTPSDVRVIRGGSGPGSAAFSYNADNGEYGNAGGTHVKLTGCPYAACRPPGSMMSRADFARTSVIADLNGAGGGQEQFPTGGKSVTCAASPQGPLLPFDLTATPVGFDDPSPTSYRFDCNADGVRQTCPAEGGVLSGGTCRCPGLPPGDHLLSCQVDDLGVDGPWSNTVSVQVSAPSLACTEIHGGSVDAGNPVTLRAAPSGFASVDQAAYRFDLNGDAVFGTCSAEGGSLGACNGSNCTCSTTALPVGTFNLGCQADTSPATGPYQTAVSATVRDPSVVVPGGDASCEDDFSSGSLASASWSQEGSQGWSVSSGTLDAAVIAGQQNVLRNLECQMDGPDVCQSMRIVADDSTSQSPGFLFRSGGGTTDDPQHPGYYVVSPSFENGGQWYWLSYDGSGFIGVEGNGLAADVQNGDYVGACLYGQGNQIQLAVYEFGSQQPGADPSQWGQPKGVLGPATVQQLDAAGEVGLRVYSWGSSSQASLDDWQAVPLSGSGSNGGSVPAEQVPGKPGTPTLILP